MIYVDKLNLLMAAYQASGNSSVVASGFCIPDARCNKGSSHMVQE